MSYVFLFLPSKQAHLHIIQISEIQTSKKCLVNVNNHLKWKSRVYFPVSSKTDPFTPHYAV